MVPRHNSNRQGNNKFSQRRNLTYLATCYVRTPSILNSLSTGYKPPAILSSDDEPLTTFLSGDIPAPIRQNHSVEAGMVRSLSERQGLRVRLRVEDRRKRLAGGEADAAEAERRAEVDDGDAMARLQVAEALDGGVEVEAELVVRVVRLLAAGAADVCFEEAHVDGVLR